MASELTHDRLCEVLDYNPETGVFRWLVTRPGTARAGSIAGSLNDNGYVSISIDGQRYKAHRLCFLYMLGRWPDPEGDHRDLNRANNVWSNLREATSRQNAANRGVRCDNMTGHKGVYRLPNGKFRLQIGYLGKLKHIGYYDTIELASWMYGVVAEALYGEFARLA